MWARLMVLSAKFLYKGCNLIAELSILNHAPKNVDLLIAVSCEIEFELFNVLGNETVMSE